MGSPAIDYEGAMSIARSDDVDARLKLATNPLTPPEFLALGTSSDDATKR